MVAAFVINLGARPIPEQNAPTYMSSVIWVFLGPNRHFTFC